LVAFYIGIGLNYADHAGDIDSAAPQDFPGSFFKQAEPLIGPSNEIMLPALKEAQKTTTEAELGIIMGKDCRDLPEENWESAIIGYTTVLDMTEESILRSREVQSVLNGEVYAKNVVSNMTRQPAKLVSLHSSIQDWYAGDILSTGTPRAFHIQEGDVAECRICGPNGFDMAPLRNPVIDLKKHPEKQ